MYGLFKILMEIPANIWLGLLIIAAPFIVLKNSDSQWWKLPVATILTYAFMLLATGTNHYLSWQAYENCYAAHGEFRDLSSERHQACQHHLQDKTNFISVVLLGWVLAVGYVGLWEMLQRCYAKEDGNLSAQYHRRFGTTAIWTFFVILAGIISLNLAALLYKLTG